MKKKRTHLYEVDLMRCLFMIAVLATHVTTSYTDAFVGETHSRSLLLASHMMLHFSRMGFMFISGLVMFLVYYNRKIKLWPFWKKHIANVGIPYVFWIGLFAFIGLQLATQPFSWDVWFIKWIKTMWHASNYYMYYLYVTMQFYLVFPLMVLLFKKTEGHHNLVLAISAIVQFCFLIYAKYIYPGLDKSNWPYYFAHYGNDIFTYQYYFILGGYVWLNYDKIKAWLQKHHGWVYGIAILLALGTWVLYLFNSRYLGMTRHYATLVHQPYLMFYGTAVIFAVMAIGIKYAEVRTRPKWQWFSRLVGITSTLSFGVYLTQTLPIMVLERTLKHLALQVPSMVLLLMFPLGLLFVLAGSWLISYLCYKIPPFGILVGRSNSSKLKALFKKASN